MRWAACQRRGQLRGPQPDLLPDSSRPTLRTGIIAWPSPFGSVAARIGAGSRRRRPSDAPAPICAPVPRGAWAAQGECACSRGQRPGLRQLPRDLCRRREVVTSQVAGEGVSSTRSAELMVEPGCGARCAIRDLRLLLVSFFVHLP
jgi:hypothetical protein